VNAPAAIATAHARTPALHAAWLVLSRDLRLAFRRPGEIVQPLLFFAIIATLFPLAITPEKSQLVVVAPGVVWVAELLASLLALEFLYREDAHDGSLEQFAISGQSLTGLLLAKSAAHWLLTGAPLAIMGPLAAWGFGAPTSSLPGVLLAVAIGSIALSLLGSIGAALTLGVRRSGVLLSVLTLPLTIPVLIFGARATQLAIEGSDFTAAAQLLGAMAVLGITLAPLAAAAAVRISLE
jgi:heme exporter protein B